MLGCGISGAGQKPPSGTTRRVSVTGLLLTLLRKIGERVSQPYRVLEHRATTEDRVRDVPKDVATTASRGATEVRHAPRPARRRRHLAGRLARPAARLLLDD